jgi:class 3 adenylate cyclase
VNIVARIESFAVPGGVMLSDSAYDQIKNRPDVGVVSLGRFRLKNVGRSFELYAVAPRSSAARRGGMTATLPRAFRQRQA